MGRVRDGRVKRVYTEQELEAFVGDGLPSTSMNPAEDIALLLVQLRCLRSPLPEGDTLPLLPGGVQTSVLRKGLSFLEQHGAIDDNYALTPRG